MIEHILYCCHSIDRIIATLVSQSEWAPHEIFPIGLGLSFDLSANDRLEVYLATK